MAIGTRPQFALLSIQALDNTNHTGLVDDQMARHHTEEARGSTEGGQYASSDLSGGSTETMVQAPPETHIGSMAKA